MEVKDVLTVVEVAIEIAVARSKSENHLFANSCIEKKF